MSIHMPFIPSQSDHPFLGYGYFEMGPWKSKLKATEGQRWMSYIDMLKLNSSLTVADKKISGGNNFVH